MTMTLAAMAFVFGMSSCSSSNDDTPEAPVANQVVGPYTGTEILTVMGEADESTETFEFTKATDASVDVTLPQYGEGMMTVPALPVKGIMHNVVMTFTQKYGNMPFAFEGQFTGTRMKL